jgi:glycosyltransferase involved in cell wall biosynthesis
LALRVGINLLAVSPSRSGGIAIYVRNLLAQLLGEPDLALTAFTNSENDGWIGELGASLTRVQLHIPTTPQALRVASEQTVLPGLCRAHGIQALHSPTYTSPLRLSVPAVVTICDMLYRVHPRSVPLVKRIYWSIAVPLSARRASRVLTLSANAKADIVRLLRVPSDKVVVTPLAGQPLEAPVLGEVSPLRRLAAQRYLLSVGALGAHKNGGALLRSVHELHQHADLRDVRLVLPGRDYGAATHLGRLARELGLSEFVHFVGQVGAGELAWLYSNAAAYVTLSRFEGFGMTVLEAMGAGVPVVCSNASALPEVAGDAALLVPPTRPEAAASALARLLREPGLRAELVSRGLERGRRFTWGTTARLTAEAYRDAIQEAAAQ